MDDKYRYVEFPLDTPDDDERWGQCCKAVSLAFNQKSPNAEEIKSFRDNARACNWRLRMMELADPGIQLPGPVATLASFTEKVNVGGETVDCDCITEVTVRAGHRRKGLMRYLMSKELHEAKEKGFIMASLTVSQGTLYERFGFNVSTRRLRHTIECKGFQLREPAMGTVEYVTPETAEPYLDEFLQNQLSRTRGFHKISTLPWNLGVHHGVSSDEKNNIHVVIHRNAEGEVDGVGSYSPKYDEKTDRSTAVVLLAVGSNARAEIELWDFFAHLELVDKLHYWGSWNFPLRWALVNPDVVIEEHRFCTDFVWIRILDVVQALEKRGWLMPGSLVLDIADSMGISEGKYRITVTPNEKTGKSEAKVELVPETHQADAFMDISILAALYFGDINAYMLADAGRIQGDVDAVARLFAVADPGYSQHGF